MDSYSFSNYTSDYYSSEDNYTSDSSEDKYSSESVKRYSSEDKYRNENTGTPKIIHQTWKDKNLPEKLENWRNMWLKMCPEYQHKLYDDSDLRQLIKTHFPQYVKHFDNFYYNIERVDFWRYAMLYVHGGVYADLDVFPMKSIDKFLEMNKVVIGREPVEHARAYNGTDFLLCNAFMISPKGDKFWLDLMDYIIKNYKSGGDPVNTVGPGIMTKMYNQYPERFKNVLITEPNCFYPITFNKSNKIQEYEGKIYKNVSKTCDMKDAYVVHMWEGSWTQTMPNWGLTLIAYGVLAVILLILLFSIAIGMGYSF